MTEAEMRRHEWQCNQGRGGPHDDLNPARGFVWSAIIGLSVWCLVATWYIGRVKGWW
jgi:hypothetical protein